MTTHECDDDVDDGLGMINQEADAKEKSWKQYEYLSPNIFDEPPKEVFDTGWDGAMSEAEQAVLEIAEMADIDSSAVVRMFKDLRGEA